MPLSSTSLNAFLEFYESVEAAIDCIPNSSPPSPIARVKGTLSNARNQMRALLNQYESREPSPKDLEELSRIGRALETLVEDKWVTDGWVRQEIDWHGAKAAEAADIAYSPGALSLKGAIAMLSAGLGVLSKEQDARQGLTS